MSKQLNERTLLFLDTETTGLNPDQHEIIDIFMVKTTHDEAMDYENPIMDKGKNWIVIPKHLERADPKALEINKFDENGWNEFGKHFEVYADEIHKYMEECTIVGFNPWFDLRFLMKEFSRIGLTTPHFNYHAVDVSSMAWTLFTIGLIDGISAKSICNFFEISYEGAHRAEVDVNLSIECYRRLCQMKL